VAREAREALDFSRPHGIADTLERIIREARTDAAASERHVVAEEVATLVASSALTRNSPPASDLDLAAVGVRVRQGHAVGGPHGATAPGRPGDVRLSGSRRRHQLAVTLEDSPHWLVEIGTTRDLSTGTRRPTP
jgi:hypothetical protein